MEEMEADGGERETGLDKVGGHGGGRVRQKRMRPGGVQK